MSCEFCDLERITNREDFDPHADYLVGSWLFTEDDDLTHQASGTVQLWHDFDDDSWVLLVLIANMSMPTVAQFHPKVCPMCGRRLDQTGFGAKVTEEK